MPNPLIRNMPVLGQFDDWLRGRKFAREKRKWESRGRIGAAPHLVKQKNISDHAQRFGTRVMVETGTFHGDMCYAMRDRFEQIYTIELGNALYDAAVKRFKNNANITLLNGDSGVVINDVLDKINEPALFWLDGHYSSGRTARGELDTPISAELEHILAHHIRHHVILIDDARCFTGENDYPTLEELEQYLKEQRPECSFEVKNDCICFIPPQPDAQR